MKDRHINVPGDDMEQKYAATYKIGKTTVHVVAPPPMPEEEKQKVLHDFYLAGWAAWNSLTREEQLELNVEAETE